MQPLLGFDGEVVDRYLLKLNKIILMGMQLCSWNNNLKKKGQSLLSFDPLKDSVEVV